MNTLHKNFMITGKKKKTVKDEPCNDDDLDLEDDMFVRQEDCNGLDSTKQITDTEDRQLNIFEKMVCTYIPFFSFNIF